MKEGKKSMALVEYHTPTDTETQNGAETSEKAGEGGFKAVLPAWDDIPALQAYLGELEAHVGVKGVPTMIERLKNYLMHMRLSEDGKKKLRSSVSFINHIPIPKQSKFAGMSDEQKRIYNLRKHAAGFFNGLIELPDGGKQLRRQCHIFGLDFMQYETLDDVVEALVEAQLAMK